MARISVVLLVALFAVCSQAVNTRPQADLPFSLKEVADVFTGRLAGADGKQLTSAFIRPINGQGNNVANPTWGYTGDELLQGGSDSQRNWADSFGVTPRTDLPSARTLSTTVFNTNTVVNSRGLSDGHTFWGQWLDHDIGLTEAGTEVYNITVAAGDPIFNTNDIGFTRVPAHSGGTTSPRRYPNDITAYVDGSQIYGEEETKTNLLRSMTGGRLRVDANGLCPRVQDITGFPGMANGRSVTAAANLYAVGDVRGNENLALTSIYHLYCREHNYWADQFTQADPTLTDEEIFQLARSFVSAMQQVVFYEEYARLLLQPSFYQATYGGYNPTVNAQVTDLFTTGIFRYGHSELPANHVLDWANASTSTVRLRDSLFNPQLAQDYSGGAAAYFEAVLAGLDNGAQQAVDLAVVADIRDFLFMDSNGVGADLIAFNIQRGRDMGIPTYVDANAIFGFTISDYSDIPTTAAIRTLLSNAYGVGNVSNVDCFVGALAETPLDGTTNLGRLAHAVIADQYNRLRNGDRFWYENLFSTANGFPASVITFLKGQRWGDILARNLNSLTTSTCQVMQTTSTSTTPCTPTATVPALTAVMPDSGASVLSVGFLLAFSALLAFF